MNPTRGPVLGRPMTVGVCFVERVRGSAREARVEKMLLGTSGLRRLAARFKLSANDTWAPPVTDLSIHRFRHYFKVLRLYCFLSGRPTTFFICLVT